jgi:hypothetical protein
MLHKTSGLSPILSYRVNLRHVAFPHFTVYGIAINSIMESKSKFKNDNAAKKSSEVMAHSFIFL